ncbi:hypothetical protein [Sediminibacillus terrae]|uniref:hypothetical protein n=1 Tax=Sediminibacillus terrae TaxID=1562106 RepID=UPI0012968B4E|nr:hypothetical protein [Sediminibacillus terrae]
MAEKEKKITKLVCKGPRNERNGALYLRFKREDKRKADLLVYPGDSLIVGKDVTEQEAKKLLNNPTWKFEGVKGNA